MSNTSSAKLLNVEEEMSRAMELLDSGEAKANEIKARVDIIRQVARDRAIVRDEKKEARKIGELLAKANMLDSENAEQLGLIKPRTRKLRTATVG